jgi:hypothetical protein
MQVLSGLLWAAFCINRPSGDRTAPYWRHIMVIDVYVAMADGVWLYEPQAHTFLPHLKDDMRALKFPDTQFVSSAQTVGYGRA